MARETLDGLTAALSLPAGIACLYLAVPYIPVWAVSYWIDRGEARHGDTPPPYYGSHGWTRARESRNHSERISRSSPRTGSKPGS